MRIHLAYGRKGLEVDLPDRHLVKVLDYQAMAPLADPAGAVADCLRRPVGTPPLVEMARGKRTACIVVCDITRPVPNALVLPPLLDALHSGGIAAADISILIATGLHRPNWDSELEEVLGPDIPRHYAVYNHDGRNLAEHRFLGHSPRGIPIWIDARFVEADLKIAVGLIEPHFMAGFSGGRKLVCPGIAARETILAWHSPALLESPLARAGSLDGNPVHEENTWIARRAGLDFVVNTVIDQHRRLLHVSAGEMDAAFASAVDVARQAAVDRLAAPVDVVVTSAAGYPLDATYYQTIKGMVAVEPIIRPGGTIIIAAEISEGVGGPEFAALFDEHPDLDSFLRWMHSSGEVRTDQWQLEMFARAAKKARITLVTDGLSPAQVRRMYVNHCASVESAVAEAIERYGPTATLAAVPKGPYVLPEIAPASPR
mgnify:CR=1 FL=1